MNTGAQDAQALRGLRGFALPFSNLALYGLGRRLGFVRSRPYQRVLRRTVTATGFAMNFYTVQEFLVVLFLLAVSTATILVIAVAFILFQEGIRWAVLWAKTGVIRLAGLRP